MSSDLIMRLSILVEQWENLSSAAIDRAEMVEEGTQNGFYTGLFFGLEIAREELAATLATAMADEVQSLAATQVSLELSSN